MVRIDGSRREGGYVTELEEGTVRGQIGGTQMEWERLLTRSRAHALTLQVKQLFFKGDQARAAHTFAHAPSKTIILQA